MPDWSIDPAHPGGAGLHAEAPAHGAGTARQAFIVFSDDWGVHPSSCQHLFRQIGVRHPVIWVNTIGMRSPKMTAGDLGKAWRKLRGMFRRPARASAGQAASDGITVIQPFMLPYAQFRWVRWLNRMLVTTAVRRCLRAAGITDAILVTTVPNACDVAGRLGERKVVYYCVDDFANWPGVEQALVRSMEEQLVARTDIFIATADTLFQRLSGLGKPAWLLTHGVDLALFASEVPSEHACLANTRAPRVGYFGLIDERTDQALVAALASLLPDHAFIFAGPVVVDVSRLQQLPNIHFVGPIPYTELPALVKGIAVLLLPYAQSVLAESLSPLKLKEYLATGKPVVSTPLREVLRMRPLVTVGTSATEVAAAIRLADGTPDTTRRIAVTRALAGEDWSDKASRFLQYCGVPADPSARGGAGIVPAAPARQGERPVADLTEAGGHD